MREKSESDWIMYDSNAVAAFRISFHVVFISGIPKTPSNQSRTGSHDVPLDFGFDLRNAGKVAFDFLG